MTHTVMTDVYISEFGIYINENHILSKNTAEAYTFEVYDSEITRFGMININRN